MTLTDQLKTARGRRYYDLLKAILAECGENIANDARAIIKDNERMTAEDVGRLSLKYDLNFKATCEWLEECEILPTGTYDRLSRLGLKIRPMMDELQKEQDND